MRFKFVTLVFLIDQVTKLVSMLLSTKFQFDGFGFSYCKSEGYLFGIFMLIPYRRWLLILLMLSALFIIQLFFRFYWLRFRSNSLTYLSFSFIVGGFIGNFFDCILFKYVRDFIIIPLFKSTNLADCFIATGLVLILIELLINKKFKELLFKLKPLKYEIELLSPIFRIPIQDFKKLLSKLRHKFS
ncbi:MAG: signal peptidase II [bacterium]|nr:signal peptidase II [bacterium]